MSLFLQIIQVILQNLLRDNLPEIMTNDRLEFHPRDADISNIASLSPNKYSGHISPNSKDKHADSSSIYFRTQFKHFLKKSPGCDCK